MKAWRFLLRRDLDFLSGKFFDYDVPKVQRYLLKYFTGKIQKAFVRYYLLFGCCRSFRDHTGIYCSWSFVLRLETKFHKLVASYQEAKADFSEEGLAKLGQIEAGKFKLHIVRRKPGGKGAK